MIIKNLPQIGNPILAKKSTPVKDIQSPETQKMIQNVIDTMRDEEKNLIGMAAVQIGAAKRIFVTELRATKNRKPKDMDELRVFINPQITRLSKKNITIYESCGSVVYAQIFAPVKRPESVEIEAYDRHGKKFSLKARGLLARVIQHEYDHLEGITFLSKVTDIRKAMSVEEWRKRKK